MPDCPFRWKGVENAKDCAIHCLCSFPAGLRTCVGGSMPGGEDNLRTVVPEIPPGRVGLPYGWPSKLRGNGWPKHVRDGGRAKDDHVRGLVRQIQRRQRELQKNTPQGLHEALRQSKSSRARPSAPVKKRPRLGHQASLLICNSRLGSRFRENERMSPFRSSSPGFVPATAILRPRYPHKRDGRDKARP